MPTSSTFARASRSTLLVLACAVAALWAPAAQEPPRRGLSAPQELVRAYEAIFDARFDDVPSLRARACGPAPPEACGLLDTVALWWRIQLDPFNNDRDAAFQSQADAAIAAASAWTQREPRRAEAWFYLGGAYAARARWRVLRAQRLAAARDGTRIKDALERALALDPDMTDASFGLGLYRYYADVAPTFLKMLRWLLLMPGGDRTAGLQEMLRARRTGLLVQGEADYQLHVVYLWYEKQPERAVQLLLELGARHPHNPHFPQAAAEILDFYIDDTRASLRTWETLLQAAQRGQVAEPHMAEASARLGIASQLDQLSQSADALPHLRAVIAGRPTTPFGAVARAQWQLGEALDHIGRRAEAAAAYRDAIASAGQHDPLGVASRARAALRVIER